MRNPDNTLSKDLESIDSFYKNNPELNKKPMNTPDTEWEKEFDEMFPATLRDDRDFGNYDARKTIKSFILSLLTSRDTYWKERVRKEVEGMRKDYEVQADGQYHFGENQKVTGWNQALDTLSEKLTEGE